MKRLKLLVAAVATVVAAAVLPTSALAAGGFGAQEYPVTLKGTPQSGFTFKSPLYAVTQCASPFDSELKAPNPDIASTSTGAPCGPSGWQMNGCQLTFHQGSKTMDIGPPGCGPTIVSSGVCAPTRIPAQTGLAAQYKVTGSGKEAQIAAEVEATSVEYFHPSGACGGISGKDMSIAGTWNIAGSNGKGEKTGLSLITGDVPVGIFMAGGPAEFGTGAPRLDAQRFPVGVTGERWSIGEFKGNLYPFDHPNFRVKCATGKFDVGIISEPVEENLEFGAEYGECTGPTGNGKVSMGSCKYLYTGLEQVVEGGKGIGRYEGSPKIDCATNGDAIKFAGPGCTISIPEQSLSGPVALLENSGSGYEAWIGSVLSSSSVKYTTSNQFGCQLMSLPPSGEDGGLRADIIFKGRFP